MTRGGINKTQVQKAHHSILARGEKPSIDAVRVELGNTGSKTTIHRERTRRRRLHRRTAAQRAAGQLGGPVVGSAKEEAQAAALQEREQLAHERLDYQNQIRLAESRIQQLEEQYVRLTEQLNGAQQAYSRSNLQDLKAFQLDAKYKKIFIKPISYILLFSFWALGVGRWALGVGQKCLQGLAQPTELNVPVEILRILTNNDFWLLEKNQARTVCYWRSE